ncbi:MAG: PepSY-associated TM helix domain-containing protein [Solitalea sp.]
MNPRNYNIFFNTHTISGIIICALLYVIFFAGSFSFFKDEIAAWQHEASYTRHQEGFPYETFLDSMDREYGLAGRDIVLYLYPNNLRAGVSLSPSKDSHNEKAAEAGYFTYDYITGEKKSYEEGYDLAEFLYRLHFLAQLSHLVPFQPGYPFGYIVAGLVAFLFLFALITGLLVHWDKLVSNFFLFRPWSKAKTMWTDLHTVLGVLSYPYQFLLAFTGIILIVNTVFIAPFTKLLYQGNADRVYEELGFSASAVAEFKNQPLEHVPDISEYIRRTEERWPGAFIKLVSIRNYGDEGMRMAIQAEADYRNSFAATGVIEYDLQQGEIVREKSPNEGASYTDWLRALVYRLHFGDYGGYFLKLVYFILGIGGCLVIVSGILIWLVARDKKTVPARKKKFNFWLANTYLSICLTMFPVTALTFILVKATGVVGQDAIYRIFFYSWLVLSVYYLMRKDYNRTNRETLLLGSVFSFCVPVANGLYSGNWPWVTFVEGATDIFFLDVVWIGIAAVTYFSYRKARHRRLENIQVGRRIKRTHQEAVPVG